MSYILLIICVICYIDHHLAPGQCRVYSVRGYPALPLASSVPVDGSGGGPHVPVPRAGVRLSHLQIHAQVQLAMLG